MAGPVVPADLGWSGVGDWPDPRELIQSDARNSVVWSETGCLIAPVGLENIAEVDTANALLVIERDSVLEVCRIVEQHKQLRWLNSLGVQPLPLHDSVGNRSVAAGEGH